MTVQPDAAAVPSSAAAVFGPGLDLAVRYAAMLASDGVLRGLIGPGEANRLWERHLLNCAVVGELIGADATVGDVGSGAGLPGIPLAIARPDLRIDLIEPMERRAAFLRDVVAALGLAGVTVTRSRGEDVRPYSYDVVTARAVAPLARLVPMALPLARIGGTLLALKGSSAAAELMLGSSAIAAAGGSRGEVLTAGVGMIESPTVVVAVRRDREAPVARRGEQRSGGNRDSKGSKGTHGGRRG